MDPKTLFQVSQALKPKTPSFPTVQARSLDGAPAADASPGSDYFISGHPVPSGKEISGAWQVLGQTNLYQPVPGFDHRIGPVEGPSGSPNGTAAAETLSQAFENDLYHTDTKASVDAALTEGFHITDVHVVKHDPAVELFLQTGSEKLSPLLEDAKKTGDYTKFLSATEDYVNAQFPGTDVPTKLGSPDVSLGEQLNSGNGVCRHKALAAKLLFDELGVPSSVEGGNMVYTNSSGKRVVEPHAWNEVQLGGKNYVFDVGNNNIGDLSQPDVLKAYSDIYNRGPATVSGDINKVLQNIPDDYGVDPVSRDINDPNGKKVGSMKPGGAAEITLPGQDPKTGTLTIDPTGNVEVGDVSVGDNTHVGSMAPDGTIQTDSGVKIKLDGTAYSKSGVLIGTLDGAKTVSSLSPKIKLKDANQYLDVTTNQIETADAQMVGTMADDGKVIPSAGTSATADPTTPAATPAPAPAAATPAAAEQPPTQHASGVSVDSKGNVIAKDGKTVLGTYTGPTSSGEPLAKMTNNELYFNMDTGEVKLADGTSIGQLDDSGNVKFKNGSILRSTGDKPGSVMSADGKAEVGTYDPAQSAAYKEALVKMNNGAYLHVSDPAGTVRTLKPDGSGTLLGNMGTDGKILMDGFQSYLLPDGTVQDLTGKALGTIDIAKSDELGNPAFKLTGRDDAYVVGKTLDVKSYDGDQFLGKLVDGPSGKMLKLPNGTYDAMDGKGTIIGEDGKTPIGSIQPDGTFLSTDGKTVLGTVDPATGKVSWKSEGLRALGEAGGLVGLLGGLGPQCCCRDDRQSDIRYD